MCLLGGRWLSVHVESCVLQAQEERIKGSSSRKSQSN